MAKENTFLSIREILRQRNGFPKKKTRIKHKKSNSKRNNSNLSKMKQMDKVELIHLHVKLPDVLGEYRLISGDNRGRICCPLHSGENRNSFSFNDEGYHCFSCGMSGDVISFVQEYNHIDFSEALERINQMFHLWASDETISIGQKKKIEELKCERKIQNSKRDQLKLEYESIHDELHRLDGNLIRFAPQHPNDNWRSEFVEACHKISYQTYLADITENWKKVC